MADASYWIYLIHVPFLAALERMASETGLPPWLQLTLSTTAAIGLALLTYATLVRYSPVGGLLHGRRVRGAQPTA